MSQIYKKRFRGPQSDRRDKEIKIRLSSSERDQVHAIADKANLSVADFVRIRLLDAGVDVEPVGRRPVFANSPAIKADPELLRQLAQLGNNLNQIARKVNRYALQANHIDVIKLFTVMLAIEQHLGQLSKSSATLS